MSRSSTDYSRYSLLGEYVLPLDISGFLHMWLDQEWNEFFLEDRLKDINVTLSEWEADEDNSACITRKLRSHHPSKISFPGLPSHAESFKTQQLFLPSHNHPNALRIKETNVFRDIPFADYFNVVVEWDVTWGPERSPRKKKGSGDGKNQKGAEMCYISIYLGFHFFKSTWLQSTIESNTRAELIWVYDLWTAYATETLSWAKNRRSDPFYWTAGEKKFIDVSSLHLMMASEGELGEEDIAEIRSMGAFNGDDSPSKLEKGEGSSSLHGSARKDTNKRSKKRERKQLMRWPPESHLHHPDMFENPGIATTKDAAVTLVEMTIVLLAYSFWRVRQLTSDITDLYSVYPEDVVKRVRGSILPGHGLKEILKKPDLWGASIGVLCLPLVLLMSMEVRKNGCNQSATLGNAFVISLTLWLALSATYRIFAVAIVPDLGMVQTMCVVGYGYFAWSAALALSYLMSLTTGTSSPLILSIPLVLLGLPSSLVQASVFWHKLQKLPSGPGSDYFGLSNTQISVAVRVRHFCKLVAILIVIILHFQSLLYLAQVYTVEKKQICHINAVLRFSVGLKERLSRLPLIP